MKSTRDLLKLPPLGPIPRTLAIINAKLAELGTSMSAMRIELVDDRDDGGDLAFVLNISTKSGKGFAVRTTEPADVLNKIAFDIEFLEALKRATSIDHRADDRDDEDE